MYVRAVVGTFRHQANGFVLLVVAICLQQAHLLQLSMEIHVCHDFDQEQNHYVDYDA